MIYTFRSTDGDVIEKELPMAEAPDLCAVIMANGKAYKRVIDHAPPLIRKDCHIVSHSQPRWSPDHKGEFSKDGKPVYTKWKEVAEYTSKASDSDYPVEYDTWSGVK